MNSFATVALATIAFACLTSAAYWEHPNKKSFYTIQQECADAYRIDNDTLCQIIANGYPEDNQTCSLVYCILNKMRAWENNTVKPEVISQFFQPADSDCTYVNRTLQCINDTVPAVCQSSEIDRACKTFNCYYRNYGEVKSDPQFLPFTFYELVWLAKLGLEITNASCSDLELMANGNITSNAAFCPAYYSYALDIGIYNLIDGYNFQQSYVQYGNTSDISDATRTCVTQVDRVSCTEPDRLCNIGNKCLGFDTDCQVFQQAASELRYGSNSTCVICTTTPVPCPTTTLAPCETTTTPAPCETTTTTLAPETTTPCGGAPNTTVTEYPVTNSTEPIQNTTLPVINTTQPCYNGQC